MHDCWRSFLIVAVRCGRFADTAQPVRRSYCGACAATALQHLRYGVAAPRTARASPALHVEHLRLHVAAPRYSVAAPAATQTTG